MSCPSDILYSNISARAHVGPRSLSTHDGSVHPPTIDMSGFFVAHVSAKSPSNISTNPSDVLSKVLEPKHNLKITSQSPPPLICLKIAVLREGGPKLFGMWNPYIFSYNSSSIHNNVCWLVHDL